MKPAFLLFGYRGEVLLPRLPFLLSSRETWMPWEFMGRNSFLWETDIRRWHYSLFSTGFGIKFADLKRYAPQSSQQDTIYGNL